MTTPEQYSQAVTTMERCRGIYRDAAGQMIARGVEPIDAALGCVFASHDLAMHAGMDPAAAIEWIRSAADLMERQLAEKRHDPR